MSEPVIDNTKCIGYDWTFHFGNNIYDRIDCDVIQSCSLFKPSSHTDVMDTNDIKKKQNRKPLSHTDVMHISPTLGYLYYLIYTYVENIYIYIHI